ncbi:MAG TPA: hypothetical protein VEU51_17120 [Candidatus Acidoferrales bacterium]|nr:hypothetical protein [Candidatus Acidoferrales bacterium]
MVLAFATPAMADATEDAHALGEAFGKALADCDQSGIELLYEGDAVAIFPGLGDEAKGKEAIGKMAIAICKSGTNKQVSSDARSVGGDYIMNVGRWEQATTGPDGKPATLIIRTTELLHKGADGKWRYLVDHASIGLPPPPPAPKVATR